MPRPHLERHRTDRVGWLRASVLGANDGILSIGGLVVGVAASGAGAAATLTSGIAGIVAGALSMAAGEYVSVRSQADTEHADIARETRELTEDPAHELQELAAIYVARGLTPELAQQVAVQLTAHDALGSHARDELGITESLRARPAQAALASAAAFSVGALLPIAAVLLAPADAIAISAASVALVALLGSGALAAWAGGASPLRGALRVGFWGALAMIAATLVGQWFEVRL